MTETYSIDTREVVERLKELVNEIIQKQQIKITVWTNGKAIRKYTGQDTIQEKYNKDTGYQRHYHNTKDKGWYKATAIIIKEEEI
jgi:predicted RNase H-related nuclease YkuK (DUF458 family)